MVGGSSHSARRGVRVRREPGGGPDAGVREGVGPDSGSGEGWGLKGWESDHLVVLRLL